jgi:DNA polymerase-3 subunit delta'
MIIWQPELMHPSAANGILKILEDPPPHTYFILVTRAADKLLPTMISRTQIITVPLLDDPDIEKFLQSEKQVEGKRVHRIAQLAEGNLSLALKLADNEEDNNTKVFIDWMRACFEKNFSGLVSMAEEYHNLDKLGQKNLIQYGIAMMRETLLNISGAYSIHRVRDEELKFIQNFSKVMNLEKIEKSFSLMNDAGYHLERNGSAKMIFLDLSLNLSKIIKPA